VPDLGGPQIRTTTDLVRAYLAAAGRRTWEQFLANQVGRRRRSGADETAARGRT
jgi:hypothetical protein